MDTITKKRFSLYLPSGIYTLIKANADLRNINITRWIIQAIVIRLKEEKKYE